MGRKRLQHNTDIFCEMFSGWRLVNDMKSLVALGSGIIEFDFIRKIQKLNSEYSKIDFHMFHEISIWFFEDLKKNNIDIQLIKEAKLKAEFRLNIILGKKNSRTKKITELNLNLEGLILTDEKEYTSEKEEFQQYNHIQKKKI